MPEPCPVSQLEGDPNGTSLCSMCQLQRGQKGCILALETEPSERRRLAELGLIQGAVVQMLRPGSSCILGLERSRLSLGRRLQNSVKVRRLTPEPVVA